MSRGSVIDEKEVAMSFIRGSAPRLIREEGMAFAFWGISPSADAVRVVIQTPTSHTLAQLRTAVAKVRQGHLERRPLQLSRTITVNRGTYWHVAAAILNAEAPSPAIVVPATALSPSS
jgi:hypothetical protein